ncbi:alginate lyase family protein [Alteromonadaceae bacterium M269]|nr:alginate lyase family protein [Alteromonadaceae bacterium M269]
MRKLSLYFHTLKYLKLTQLYYRVLKRFSHPKIRAVSSEKASTHGAWQEQELYLQKFISTSEVKFLNHSGFVNKAGDWNNPNEEKLWLYNLHYFDDLVSFGSDTRKDLQQHWINRWIDENPVAKGGNGWEAYTLSLRIVNWVKFSLVNSVEDNKILNSLALQADFLSQDLEKHLLGNHYFVNLKALIFAGCFFAGKDADRWLSIGLKDFEREINEQVLGDGGSFELTPMYHAIMLTDLLDLYNLFQTFSGRVPSSTVKLVESTIINMFRWLDVMSHADKKIGFFNDSAFGIAPETSVLRDYANALGLDVDQLETTQGKLEVFDLHQSGYVSVKSPEMNLIADLAEVGPSYIPGHAHADTLSFEFSLGKNRVLVNSGTSQYGISEERLRQRSTLAHNTVEINEMNSSEVWSGFRVARRADIVEKLVGKVIDGKAVSFFASHNGYRKLGVKCQHKRSWSVSKNELSVEDSLNGEFDSAVANLHLHPEVDVLSHSDDTCLLNVGEYQVQVSTKGAHLVVEESSWHPEFGISLPSKKIRLEYHSSKVIHHISWKKA